MEVIRNLVGWLSMRKIKNFFKGFVIFILMGVLIVAGILFYRTFQFTKTVNAYRSEVSEIAADEGIEEYTDTILGIMYTESKGRGTDLMQSSESAYGTTGQISSQEESLKQGVSHFAESLKLAEAAGCDLSTAIQAYNFGFKYIDYVKENGGENTVSLAENYSRDVLSPGMGNTDQSQYRYMKIQSLMYNGGYLYRNGGNMFYAEIVEMNRKILDFFAPMQK